MKYSARARAGYMARGYVIFLWKSVFHLLSFSHAVFAEDLSAIKTRDIISNMRNKKRISCVASPRAAIRAASDRERGKIPNSFRRFSGGELKRRPAPENVIVRAKRISESRRCCITARILELSLFLGNLSILLCHGGVKAVTLCIANYRRYRSPREGERGRIRAIIPRWIMHQFKIALEFNA